MRRILIGVVAAAGGSLSGCAGGADGSAPTGLTLTTISADDSDGTASSTDGDGGSSGAPVSTSNNDDTGQGSDSTSAGPGQCGNGVVDPGETCDDDNGEICDGCEQCDVRTTLFLDGVAGHAVEVTDVVGRPLTLLGTALTVEAWIRLDAPGQRIDIMRRGAGNSGWSVTMTNAGVTGSVFNGFDHIVAGMNLAGTGWHHVAWVYDLATSALYLDGATVGTMAAASAVLDANQPARVGARSDGTGAIVEYTVGRVDEVRVSNAARYPASFAPVRRHTADAQTVLLLHLDEDGSGMGLDDASTNAHSSTTAGAIWDPDGGYNMAQFCP